MTILILQLLLAALGLGATVWAWWANSDNAKKVERDKLHADWKSAVESGDPARISDMFTRMRAFKP